MKYFGAHFVLFFLYFLFESRRQCWDSQVSWNSGNEFEYSQQAKWYDDYKQCSFTKQSPIELSSEEAIVSYEIPLLCFLYYDSVYPTPATIQNNGHTANIALPKPSNYIPSLWKMYDEYKPQMSGGPLPSGAFIADSVHFHWGSKDAHGSEHVIDSHRFSMEMHIVHRNSKYSSVEEARDHEDGLAVLSVIYNVVDDATEFAGLKCVVASLGSIMDYEEEALIDGFSLNPLLGELERDEYFTYQGSLTTPPCSEAVTWIVLANPLPITHQQMTAFHSLINPHGEVLENNYRFLQSKGSRSVILRKSSLKLLVKVLNSLRPIPYTRSNKV